MENRIRTVRVRFLSFAGFALSPDLANFAEDMARAAVILFLMLAGLAAPARAIAPETLERFIGAASGLSAKELAREGYSFLEKGRRDSAELYFLAGSMRYSENLSYREQVNAVISMNNLGYIYLFHDRNGEDAFRILSRARKIAEQKHFWQILDAVYDNLAKIYDDFGDTASALRYYRQSFALARRERHEIVEIMAYTDLCAMALARNMLDSIRPEMRAVASEKFSASTRMGRYTHALTRGLRLLLDGDARRASAVLADAERFIDSKVDVARYHALHALYMSKAHTAGGHTDAARAALRRSERTALADSLSDMLPGIYSSMAQLESLAGNRAAAESASMRSLTLRDSLYSARSFGKIKDMESSAVIDDLNRSLYEAEASRNHRNVVILILSLSVLIVLMLLWLLSRRNRSLRTSYEALARRASELADSGRPVKTAGSTAIPLSAAEQTLLADSIRSVMESDPRIFSPDFSVEELSETVGSKVKYVSAVINSSFGKSFSNLLADYRIREACRLLKDPEISSSMSLEGVAEKVGYRSRSHFSTVFKKVTSLTPTKYAALAKSV